MEINTIYNEDCLETMSRMSDNSIDFIFTDPPYGHNNNNNGDLISRWEAALGKGNYIPDRDNIPILNDGQEAIGLYEAFIKQANRVLVKNGICCCCGGGGGPDPQFAKWSLIMDSQMQFKHMVVWDKGPMGMGWHYRRSYEVVLVAAKKGSTKHNWYDTTNKIENIIRHIPKIIPSKDQHPTEKPVRLAKHFIDLHTKPGDLVLDPFCGSGSTLVAAKELYRNYIGIELDPKFVKMSQDRLMGHNEMLPFIEDNSREITRLDTGKL